MTINIEVKGQLARLLATENLIVEHRQVSTAQFNVSKRILTLPLWETASQDVYDLLVGHEVGHALFTPNEDWNDIIPVENLPKSFLNVTEDARIEKLMKRKFPGLGRNFCRGYQELNDDDFFGIADDDIEELTLIDRINLHFKIGIHTINSLIPFKDEEKQFVEMVSVAETFKEAIEAAYAIFNYQKDHQTTIKNDLDLGAKENGEPGSGSLNSSEQQNSEEGFGDFADEQQPDENFSEQQDSEESDISSSDGAGLDAADMEAKTDKSLTENLEKLTKKLDAFNQLQYVEIPKYDAESYIVPITDIHHDISEYYDDICKDVKNGDEFTSWRLEQAYKNILEYRESYNAFKKEAQKEVNYLVKEFEMKKSADAYSRSSISRTGVLNTNKLHTYKWNEDLFKKVAVVPNSKNHGMIFMLDWSGSMTHTILPCVKQILNLTWFCRKVNISFEVYAFSNSANIQKYKLESAIHAVENQVVVHSDLRFLHLLSGKTNNSTFEIHARNLYSVAASLNFNSSLDVPIGLNLGGTPLNQSICLYDSLIDMFHKKYRTQKLTFITLTDGEDGGITFRRRYEHRDYLGYGGFTERVHLRNRKNGRVYPSASTNIEVTSNFINYVKDLNPTTKFINIRICTGSEAKYFIRTFEETQKIDAALAAWDKTKCHMITKNGYHAQYVLPGGAALTTTAEFNVDENATHGQIRSAFTKMLKKKSFNKKFLTLFMEEVA